MTRIATFGQSQILLQDVLRNEARVFDGQRKVTSGIEHKDYKGFAIDVTTIAGAKDLKTSSESFLHDNDQVMRRLDLFDLNLRALRDAAQGLRDDVLAAVNGNTGVALRQKIDDYWQSAVSLLDARDNGRYIFSGTLTDQSPVVSTANTPAGLAAIGSDVTAVPTDVFGNNNVLRQARIDDALTLTYGAVASDVADELAEALRRLMRYDDNTETFGFATGGPFAQPMTDDQRNFLMGEIDRLNAMIDDVDEAHSTNGVHQRTVEDAQFRLADNVTFITMFIADIEDADMGVAISRLQQDQLALDASFRMLGQLARVTLLDFI
jgi:flagellar hook-associated protein 3 FlgL